MKEKQRNQKSSKVLMDTETLCDELDNKDNGPSLMRKEDGRNVIQWI